LQIEKVIKSPKAEMILPQSLNTGTSRQGSRKFLKSLSPDTGIVMDSTVDLNGVVNVKRS